MSKGRLSGASSPVDATTASLDSMDPLLIVAPRAENVANPLVPVHSENVCHL
jgi:hypothetical protein